MYRAGRPPFPASGSGRAHAAALPIPSVQSGDGLTGEGVHIITKYVSTLYIGMDEVFQHHAQTFEKSDLNFHFQCEFTSVIDIRDYVTGIGNGARALHKLHTNFNVLSVLRLLRFELGATSRNGFFL